MQPLPEPPDDSPIPRSLLQVGAYAWQHAAVETILFHGAGSLTTAAGTIPLESGTWLLARWAGPPLKDTPDGELICLLPESPP